MILLGISLLTLVGVHLLARFCIKYSDRLKSYAFSFNIKVHEVIIFFFTLSIVLEIEYSQSSAYKIGSAFLCAVLNIYLLLFNLRNFYSLHHFKMYTTHLQYS